MEGALLGLFHKPVRLRFRPLGHRTPAGRCKTGSVRIPQMRGPDPADFASTRR